MEGRSSQTLELSGVEGAEVRICFEVMVLCTLRWHVVELE